MVAIHKPRFPLSSGMIAAAITGLTLVCVILATLQIISSRGQQEFSQTDGQRMTQVLANYLELHLANIDHTVQQIAERQYMNDLFGRTLEGDMQHYLEQQLARSPMLLGLGVVNERGRIALWAGRKSAQLSLMEDVALDHYDFFNAYLQAPETGVQLVPLVGQTYQGLTPLLFAERWDKVDSSFGGAIIAIVDPTAIQRYFQGLRLGNSTTLLILGTNGDMVFATQQRPAALAMLRTLIRNTAQPDSERGNVVVVSGSNAQKMLMLNATGAITTATPNEQDPPLELPQQENSETHWYDARASVATVPTAISVEAQLQDMLKQTEHSTFSFKHLSNFPLVISLVSEEESGLAYLSKSYMNLALFPLLLGLVALAIIGLTLKMARQVRHVQNSEKSALLASQAKSDFLAKMSHELRTPLNAIIGFSEMMEAGYFGNLNEKQQERVRDINMCGTHLLELINDILDFSKGEAGKLTLHDEEVNIYALVEKVVRIIDPRARNSHVMLEQDIAERLPFLYVDERKLRQILLNLLTNAVKFTPSGGRVSLKIFLDDQHNCIFVVKDTGIGIAAEDIPKAFSVFGQIKKPGHYEGTGLGLPLCKMFVELHGGRLHLESEEGVGTTITVTLPPERVLMLSARKRFLEAA